MKLISFPLFFFLFVVTLFPKSDKDSLVAVGNEESFNFRFVSAENTFRNLISKYPQSSLGYYYIARNSLWIYLANKDSLKKRVFLENLELAKEKAEKELDRFPENAKINYNFGNIKFLESIYNTSEQETMNAFWALKKAVSYYKDAIEKNDSYYAPYLPLGIIKYALGYVPGFLKWAISVTALSGNQQEGINYLTKAFKKCYDCKTEAAYHLGKAYTEYNAMYDSAEIYLSQIVAEYPSNELFLYQYAILLIDKRELEKAKKILNRILFNKHYQFQQTYALSFFLKGEIYYKQNKFVAAIDEYEKFITEAISIDYTGYANLKIAVSYEILGNKHKAQHYYLLARNGNENIFEDEYAIELSQNLFNKQFTEIDKILIKAENMVEAGKFSNAIRILNTIDEKRTSKEENFTASVIRIEALQYLDNWEKSRKIVNKFLKYKPDKNYNKYCKFLYLSAKQFFADAYFQKADKLLEDAFDTVNAANTKLKRLLINLEQKIEKKIN